jgi:hypothetical protein
MAHTRTTVSISPERAEKLRAVRDERDLRSIDAALEAVLEEVST